MIQVIRKIGNSQGILLPRTLLREAGIEQAVDVELTADGLLLKALKKHPRDGWDEAFDRAEAAGDQPEGDLFEGIGNQFDAQDWTW
jgi:antitoxin MazE